MARDTSGPKNEPQYAGGGVPADAGDLTELGAFAAMVGNFKVGPTTGTATGPGGSNTGRTTSSGSDVWEGLEWWDTTLLRPFRYTGGAWADLSVKQHAEFLFNRSAITDGVNTLFSTSVDSGNTNDTVFATISGTTGQTVTLVQAGIYSIDFYFQVAAASTGRFGGTITVTGSTPNAAIAQNASWSQENALSTSLSNYKAAANTPVLFSVEKHTGGASDISTRIRVTRHGNA